MAPGTGLVIFDCDGVLVDSERIANSVFAELITGIGLPTSFEESVATYMGRSMPTCLGLIEEWLGAPVPGDLKRLYYQRIYAAFDRELEGVPGVIAALDAVEEAGATVFRSMSELPALVVPALEGLAPKP